MLKDMGKTRKRNGRPASYRSFVSHALPTFQNRVVSRCSELNDFGSRAIAHSRMAAIRQFHFRLVDPVVDVHLAKHRRRRSEVLAGMLVTPAAMKNAAQAEVRMSGDRSHAMALGER